MPSLPGLCVNRQDSAGVFRFWLMRSIAVWQSDRFVIISGSHSRNERCMQLETSKKNSNHGVKATQGKDFKAECSKSFIRFICVCLKMVSTPLYPMVLLIIIPIKCGFADHYPYEKWLAIIGKINPTLFVSFCSEWPQKDWLNSQHPLGVPHNFKLSVLISKPEPLKATLQRSPWKTVKAMARGWGNRGELRKKKKSSNHPKLITFAILEYRYDSYGTMFIWIDFIIGWKWNDGCRMERPCKWYSSQGQHQPVKAQLLQCVGQAVVQPGRTYCIVLLLQDLLILSQKSASLGCWD